MEETNKANYNLHSRGLCYFVCLAGIDSGQKCVTAKTIALHRHFILHFILQRLNSLCDRHEVTSQHVFVE